MPSLDRLVAPVLEERAATHNLYLPEHAGGVHDGNEGSPHPGGQAVAIGASLGHPPLLARAGAIVPVDEDGEIDLRVFGPVASEGAGLLYRDDSETSAWRASGHTARGRTRPDAAGAALQSGGTENLGDLGLPPSAPTSRVQRSDRGVAADR
ncbi:hypothetical protein [Aureimonas pseudogalii]|uniref:Alpha-glucosidase (Family GH31 glycosyl hydrolase) n=1 Tax=Aureimonas pseudogalii TaxID=1744844 RepID=A0A7W6H882_9HYPH|nr:hypothetical protein [Aureimonas pseudogalii]MBB4000226.1 alpha-glucosidase (family GH31 glycosyl hydrolase) [Aureimonas pseudogalii]